MKADPFPLGFSRVDRTVLHVGAYTPAPTTEQPTQCKYLSLGSLACVSIPSGQPREAGAQMRLEPRSLQFQFTTFTPLPLGAMKRHAGDMTLLILVALRLLSDNLAGEASPKDHPFPLTIPLHK